MQLRERRDSSSLTVQLVGAKQRYKDDDRGSKIRTNTYNIRSGLLLGNTWIFCNKPPRPR